MRRSALIALVVLSGALGGCTSDRSASDGPSPAASESRRAASDDPAAYRFESSLQRYPVVARGEFRGLSWRMLGVRRNITRGVHRIALTFEVDTPEGKESTPGEVLPADDPLIPFRGSLTTTPADYVFGATTPNVHSVVAEIDGQEFGAQMYTGYNDRSTITAQYFAVFIPPGASGHLIARDHRGKVVGRDDLSSL